MSLINDMLRDLDKFPNEGLSGILSGICPEPRHERIKRNGSRLFRTISGLAVTAAVIFVISIYVNSEEIFLKNNFYYRDNIPLMTQIKESRINLESISSLKNFTLSASPDKITNITKFFPENDSRRKNSKEMGSLPSVFTIAGNIPSVGVQPPLSLDKIDKVVNSRVSQGANNHQIGLQELNDADKKIMAETLLSVAGSAVKAVGNWGINPNATYELLSFPLRELRHAQDKLTTLSVEDVEIIDLPGATRLEFMLNGEAQHQIQKLAQKNSVRLILSNTRLRNPLPPLKTVSSPIYGLHASERAGDLRIDLALKPDTRVQSSMVSGRNHSKLVVDLSRSEEEQAMEAFNEPIYTEKRSLPDLPPLAKEHSTRARVAATEPLVTSDVVPAVSSSSQGTMTLTPRQDRDSDADFRYRDAMKAEKSRQKAMAEVLLKANLQAYPEHLATRLALAKLYSESDLLLAENLVQEGLVLAPHNSELTKQLARYWMSEDKTTKAIELLEENAPKLEADLDYHALLAALYQKTGEHKQALYLYEKLVSYHPDRAVWWMGLGISQQADGKHNEALKSYQRSKNEAGLNKSLLNFVNERINELDKKEVG